MTNIPLIALTNTFDYWRIQTNSLRNKLNRLTLSDGTSNGIYRVFANTITANVALNALGTATVTGLATFSGHANVGTSFHVSGNTVLGVAGKKTIVNGMFIANGTISVNTNITVGANTTVKGSLIVGTSGNFYANGSAGVAGYALKSTGTGIYWDAVGSGSGGLGSNNLIITGNALIGGNASISTSNAAGTNTHFQFNGARLTNYTEHAVAANNTGASIVMPSTANILRYTLNSAAVNLIFPAASTWPDSAPAVKAFMVYLKQDGTGSRTPTFVANGAGSFIAWNNSATQPVANETASAVTIYTFMKFDGDPVIYGSLSFIDD